MNVLKFRKFGIGDRFALRTYEGRILQRVILCCLEYEYGKLVLMTYGIYQNVFSEISIDKRLYNKLYNSEDVRNNISDYMTRGMLYRLFMHSMSGIKTYRNVWYIMCDKRNRYIKLLIKQ
jgi:hypothetical protein